MAYGAISAQPEWIGQWMCWIFWASWYLLQKKRWCPLSGCLGSHWDKAQLLCTTAPKKGSSLLLGTGLWSLVLPLRTFYSWPSGNLHGFWIDRSELMNSQHWICPHKQSSAHGWESCHGHLSAGPMPRLLGQQCCEVHAWC